MREVAASSSSGFAGQPARSRKGGRTRSTSCTTVSRLGHARTPQVARCVRLQRADVRSPRRPVVSDVMSMFLDDDRQLRAVRATILVVPISQIFSAMPF